jgi:hypothetical protein
VCPARRFLCSLILGAGAAVAAANSSPTFSKNSFGFYRRFCLVFENFSPNFDLIGNGDAVNPGRLDTHLEGWQRAGGWGTVVFGF